MTILSTKMTKKWSKSTKMTSKSIKMSIKTLKMTFLESTKKSMKSTMLILSLIGRFLTIKDNVKIFLKLTNIMNGKEKI